MFELYCGGGWAEDDWAVVEPVLQARSGLGTAQRLHIYMFYMIVTILSRYLLCSLSVPGRLRRSN